MNVTTKQNKTIIFIFTMQTYKVKDLIVLYNNVYQDNEISLKKAQYAFLSPNYGK
jgi:hypothetical protein